MTTYDEVVAKIRSERPDLDLVELLAPPELPPGLPRVVAARVGDDRYAYRQVHVDDDVDTAVQDFLAACDS